MDEITKTTKFPPKMLTNVLDTVKTSFNTSESSIHEDNQYTTIKNHKGSTATSVVQTVSPSSAAKATIEVEDISSTTRTKNLDSFLVRTSALYLSSAAEKLIHNSNTSRLNCGRTFFTRTDTDGFINWKNENLAITNLPG